MNPLTERLAAISGLQPCGKREISHDTAGRPALTDEQRREINREKVRKHEAKRRRPPNLGTAWTPERRAKHAKMMRQKWRDPEFVRKQEEGTLLGRMGRLARKEGKR
jgi:sRNA-binding protein